MDKNENPKSKNIENWLIELLVTYNTGSFQKVHK